MTDDADRTIRRSWDVNADAWTEAVRSGRIESRVNATDDAVIAAVRALGAASVLDIGCGEGWLCRALAGFGLDVTGFDASAALVDRAAAAGPGAYRTLAYDEFSAAPERAGGPFDVAVCNFSLLGMDILPVLRAAAAVLTPNGHLVIQTVHPFTAASPDEPYEDGWRSEDFRSLGDGFSSSMPWYYRTVGSWIASLGSAGFELVECREPMAAGALRPASLLLTGRARLAAPPTAVTG